MVVVVVIMIMTALAMPAISSALAEQRTNQAALDLVRLARRARSAAAAYGRAHVLRYEQATPVSGNPGHVELWRGINNGCTTNNWDDSGLPAYVGLATADCANSPMCLEDLSMAQGEYLADSHMIQMRVVDGTNSSINFNWPLDICYEPVGSTMWRDGNQGFTKLNQGNVNGGFRFRFRPLDRGSSTKDGVDRFAVLPLGGDPRILR